MTQNTHNFADAAGRYALSLFEISKEEKVLEQVEQNILFVDSALKKSKDFKKFITNPCLSKIARLKVLEKLGSINNFNNFFTNFLKILVQNNRIFFVEKIVKDFKNILSNFRGELNAKVSMPTQVSSMQIKEIKSMLNTILKKKINLEFKHDPNLISGAKIQIGSVMVDDTAKAKFNKILKNL
mgnify:CR=1 FL=1